ncbi:MAG: hypothetical protein QXO46_08205, partial [Nitrososphaerota archaeon]
KVGVMTEKNAKVIVHIVIALYKLVLIQTPLCGALSEGELWYSRLPRAPSCAEIIFILLFP